MATATSSAESKTEVKATRTASVGNSAWRGTALVVVLRIAVIALALVLWQLMSGPVLPEYAVSKPTDVSHALWRLLGSSTGWTDIRTTAFEIVAGFGIGVAIGTVMGLVLGSVPLMRPRVRAAHRGRQRHSQDRSRAALPAVLRHRPHVEDHHRGRGCVLRGLLQHLSGPTAEGTRTRGDRPGDGRTAGTTCSVTSRFPRWPHRSSRR